MLLCRCLFMNSLRISYDAFWWYAHPSSNSSHINPPFPTHLHSFLNPWSLAVLPMYSWVSGPSLEHVLPTRAMPLPAAISCQQLLSWGRVLCLPTLPMLESGLQLWACLSLTYAATATASSSNCPSVSAKAYFSHCLWQPSSALIHYDGVRG